MFGDGSTGGAPLTLGLGFSTEILNLTDLSSITFGPAYTDAALTTPDVRFVAFDNVVYTGHPDVVAGGVPEPAAWTMMVAGFGGLGALIRRRRRAIALAA